MDLNTSGGGVSDLKQLLAGLRPLLQPGQFVFVSLPDPAAFPGLSPILQFKEAEGWTLILLREEADRTGLDYEFVAAWITLRVHSSLSAVGLTAAFSRALTEAHLTCNVVAGFHHDHLFVPWEDRVEAMEVLKDLSEAAKE